MFSIEYVFFGYNFLLVQIDMKHHFPTRHVAIVWQGGIESQEDCLSFSGLFHENGVLTRRIGAIEGDDMLAFRPQFVSLDVSDKYKLGVFGFINGGPLAFKHRLAFLHFEITLKYISASEKEMK